MVAGSRLLAAAALVVDIISGLRHTHGIQQQVAASIAALMGVAMLALLLLNGVVAVHNGKRRPWAMNVCVLGNITCSGHVLAAHACMMQC